MCSRALPRFWARRRPATVTIADDDPAGLIDFESLHYDVNETDGQATVTVERLGGVGGAVSVDYETSDGSATAGSDYAATSGTLNWAAGDSADKTFTVPVNWDGRAEGTESISLALTNPGGGSDLGPTTAAVLRIGDDGASGPLALSSSAYSVGEADGVVTISVTRSGGSARRPGHGRLRDQRRHGHRGLRLRRPRAARSRSVRAKSARASLSP